MIRKPDQREFRESGTVSALRDARTLAREGARGLGEGSRMLVGGWLVGIMGLGLVLGLLNAAGVGGTVVLAAIAVAIFKSCNGRRAKSLMPRAAPEPIPVALGGVAGVGAETYELSIGAIGRSAAMLAMLSFAIFLSPAILPALRVMMVVGIVAFALALLQIARVFGDRTVLHYDGESVSVRGLLGESTMLWSDIESVTAERCSRLDLRTLFTSGARHNIVLRGMYNRLGGPTTLSIPIDLIALDRDAMIALVKRFQALCVGLVPETAPTPRLVLVPVPATRIPTIAERTAEAATAPFDPDAIMARYLADRDQLIASQRPELVSRAARPAFGRKTTSNA